MNLEELVSELSAVAEVRRDEPLSRHTTFGIGGPADVYVKANTVEELRRAAAVARRHGAPVFILGSGSNILVGDGGIRGVVIENNAKGVRGPWEGPDGTVLLEAESGCNFPSLARRLCREGFTGLEWAVGIPGTLGGAVVYNAGAYGGCLADVLVAITVADEEDRVREIPAEELGLVYR
ncbi:MAG TPA: FAD-binding protein, partial [Dehalococcoidia bacterium]